MTLEYLEWVEEQRELTPVNVASVAQRSPFRYAGGKTWLVPYFRQWMYKLGSTPQEFIEPFAGGGIISLTVAFERLATHVTMIEKDEEVAAVWQAVLSDSVESLCQRIVDFDLTAESVTTEFANKPQTIEHQAFHTILKNRVNRGGILAAGSGRIKAGENGKGIASRWYPQTLKRRLLDIAAIRERIAFVQGDGVDFLRKYTSTPQAAFFLDPPYTAAGKKAGKRLYKYNQIDHAELFQLASQLHGPFLMTYDDNEEILQLAIKHGFCIRRIPMKNTHHACLNELLITRFPF